MKSLSLANLISIGTSLLLTSMLNAAQFPSPKFVHVIPYMCEEDSLNVTETRERLNWAKDNDIIPRRTFNKWYYTTVADPETGELKIIINPAPYYPIFGEYSGGVEYPDVLWIPENNGMPVRVPEPNVWLSTCPSVTD